MHELSLVALLIGAANQPNKPNGERSRIYVTRFHEWSDHARARNFCLVFFTDWHELPSLTYFGPSKSLNGKNIKKGDHIITVFALNRTSMRQWSIRSEERRVGKECRN